ncbi:hypothetical protein [Gordonia sp. VNK21]|uniref:hypothetical protein n=1 Tax=Gordonia sp. VNK21 TaxID=3382483 RepID=UPI0038D3B500
MPTTDDAPPGRDAALGDLLFRQDGVIARRQALAVGCSPEFIRCRLRRREWARPVPGVYVTHTGPLSWRQRAWVAILDLYPAALAGRSALTPGVGAIHIAVACERRAPRRPGVVVRRRSRLQESVDWHLSPPRLTVDEAVLDLAGQAATDHLAVAVLTDAVGRRLTTADRILAAARRRPRLRRRAFLLAVLHDIAAGTCSVLEHRYLTDVERAHGLPVPRRQAPTTVGRHGFRDADYPDLGVAIELDGRSRHDGPGARDRDLERDLDAVAGAGRTTVRLGPGQVFDRPCLTAAKVAAVLTAHGWTGTLERCPHCPGDGPVPQP